jgi:hypothetical protein
MTEASAIVIAAAITGLSGIFTAAFMSFKKMRQENRADHGAVMAKLDSVKESVDSVSDRLDNHIEWHLDSK